MNDDIVEVTKSGLYIFNIKYYTRTYDRIYNLNSYLCGIVTAHY